MNAIVVADLEWNIGIKGQLLAHLPGDLKYFKKQTKEKIVIMGRKTFESLPNQNPLPYRTNIIMSKNLEIFKNNFSHKLDNFKNGRVVVVKDKDEFFEFIKGLPSDEIFVIGGEQIYDLLLPYCNKVYVTRLNKIFEADTKFQNIDIDSDWKIIYKSEEYNENDIVYNFTIYERNKENNHV